MASTTMKSSASGKATAMKSTSRIGTATLESATADLPARAGHCTTESIAWTEPVAVSTCAHAR